MRRTIVGLALAAALGLLAGGTNFGCAQNAADPTVSGSSVNQPQPGTSGTVTGHGSGCPCGH